MTEETDNPKSSLNKIVDFHIPLYWVLTVMGTAIFYFFSMDSTVKKIANDMAKMQVNVESIHSQISSTSSNLALLQFRLETAESEIRDIKDKLAAREARANVVGGAAK